MLNKVILEGRLVKDVELKETKSGAKYTSFTLAVPTNSKKVTEFIPCVAWNKLAEVMTNYLHQGNLISVEGKLQVRTKKDNNESYKVYTNVVCSKVNFIHIKQSLNDEIIPEDHQEINPSNEETLEALKEFLTETDALCLEEIEDNTIDDSDLPF